MKTAINILKINRSKLQATVHSGNTIFNQQRKEKIKELDNAIEILEKYFSE